MIGNLSGQSVKGYELQEQIGFGGFGAVYRAYQPTIPREVAVKVTLPQFANEPNFIRRFESEAQIVARLQHPNIIPLFDYWRDPEGAYMIMPYLKGGNLYQAIQNISFTSEQLVQIVDQIISALELAHRHQVIHRDIKPHNILLDENNNAFLSDFGIARVMDSTISEASPMAPLYAAPEQFDNGPITPQTDIYSFGILLFELLTGQHPFAEIVNISPYELAMLHMRKLLPTLPSTSQIPASVNDIIQKATAKDPQKRYEKISQLAADFHKMMLGITRTQDMRTLVQIPDMPNPYKGLKSFEEADEDDFFGRDILVSQLLERLEEPETRFLALVGPSGCGKSSILQAGLIPKLRAGAISKASEWFIVQMVPSQNPIEQLANSLLSVAPTATIVLEQLQADMRGLVWAIDRVTSSADSDVLLVVDNFEELFTLVDDEKELMQFMKLLETAISDINCRLRVIIALRADFYDQPLYYQGFGHLMQTQTVIVLPMTATEIEDAILNPAKRVGLIVEADCLVEIITEVEGEPGTLPLLQHTLTEAFDYREGNRLTLNSYRATGGIVGSLSRSAEEVYASLADPGDAQLQDLTRQIFLRLIALGEGIENTGRRVARSELVALADANRVDKILNAFEAYSLVTFDNALTTREPTVEIAHEALITAWDRLHNWLDDNREDLRIGRWLHNVTVEWLRGGQDPSYLATGARLSLLETWSSNTKISMTLDEQDFLATSISQRQKLKAQEDARQQREMEMLQQTAEAAMIAQIAQKHAANRSRILAGVFFLGTILALLLANYAFRQSQKARTAQTQAELSASEASSNALAFRAQVELNGNNVDIALALALAAAKGADSPSAARSALVQAAYALGTRSVFIGHTAPIMSMALSPDGKYLLSGAGRYSASQPKEDDNSIRLWDSVSGQEIQQFIGHTDTVWSVAFSPDGKTIASASLDETVRLWDITTGEQIASLPHRAEVRSVAFSPDGTQLITGAGHSGAGSDGEVADPNPSVILWDVTDQRQVCRFEGPTSEIRSVDFSPDGTQILAGAGAELSGSGDNSVYLWNVKDCHQFQCKLIGHHDIVQGVQFSPDGKWAVSASADHLVILWDVVECKEIRRFNGHGDWVNQVIFSPDGNYLLSGGWDNKILLWNIHTGNIERTYQGHKGAIRGFAFAHDGNSFFSAAQDQTLRHWDFENILLIHHFQQATSQYGRRAIFSPDNLMAITGSSDGTLLVWDVQTGQQRGQFVGHEDEIASLDFDPTGNLLLTGASDQQVILWDTNTHKEVGRFTGHSGRVWSVDISDNGQFAASGSDDTSVRLWDIATQEQLSLFDTELSEVYTVAFTPDNQYIIAGTLSDIVVVLEIVQSQNDFSLVERARMEGHQGAVWANAISHNGRYLVTGSYDNTLILWDLERFTEIRRFYGHTSTIFGIEFSPDDHFIISGSSDETVRIWDTASGEELGRIDYGINIQHIDVSDDGKSILLASETSQATLYQLPIVEPETLKDWIRENRYVYELTPSECDIYDTC